MAMFASGTPGDPDEDGSADQAPENSGEPQDDGSDDGAGDDLEAARAENERLRNANRQLLSEKTAAEEARRENRTLRQLVVDMNRRALEVASAPTPADATDWDSTLKELAESDDPRDKVTLELVKELSNTRKKLAAIERKDSSIPEEDRAAVDELMASGDYRTEQAAYKAHLSDKLAKELEKLKARPAAPKKPGDSREPGAKPVTGTTMRSVPREKATKVETVTSVKATEYREHLRGPDGAKWRQRRLEGKLEVILDQ